MLTVNDLQRLKGLTGITLIDACADLVGLPRPSELAKPITTARPDALAEKVAEWEALAGRLQDRRESLERHVNGATANWSGDSAESFGRYAAELVTVLRAQEDAVREVPPVLAAMQDCALEAQRDWEDFITGIAKALILALAPAILAALVLWLVPELTVTKIIALELTLALILAIILIFLFAILDYLVVRRRQREDCLDGGRKKMRKLGKRGSEEARIRAVSPPPAPVITSAGFSAIDMPPAFRAGS